MGIGWLKKLAKVGKVIVEAGAKIDPEHFGPVELLINGVEEALPNAPGGDKKKAVEFVSDLALTRLQAAGTITAEQVVLAQDLRSKAIDTYIASENAQVAAFQARDAYNVLLNSFQHPKP